MHCRVKFSMWGGRGGEQGEAHAFIQENEGAEASSTKLTVGGILESTALP